MKADTGARLFAPDTTADAYASYANLRRRGTVVYDADLDYWVLGGYAAVRSVLVDPRFGVSDRNARHDSSRAVPALRSEMFLFLDSPRHEHLRSLCAAPFHPRRVAALRPLVTCVVRNCIAGIEHGETDDLIGDLAAVVPVRIIAEILGLPQTETASLQRWSSSLAGDLVELVKPVGARPAAARGLAELSDFLLDLFRQRRRRPRADPLSVLVADCTAGKLTESELLSTSLLLLLAGHETTANLIGSAIYNLARFPEQRRRLTRSPALIDSAVEEMLRFDSPIQATRRIVHSNAIVDGRRLGAGERVLLLLGSANRDPEVFERPEELDVGRHPNRHLAFATGGHACLGAGLARLETRIVLAELLRSMPQYRIDGEAARWKTSTNLRGLRSLRVLR